MQRFLALMGAAALLSIVPATPALADGAVIGEGEDCYGKVPNADGTFPTEGDFIAGSYTSRTTKSGITNFTCHFDLTDEQAPPKNRKASNFACGTPMGLATSSRINASPGGRMVMTCSVKP